MAARIEYTPRYGVCSSLIEVEVDSDGYIVSAEIRDGCMGNTTAVAQLSIGMKAQDVIDKLQGTKCTGKQSSCPDQFACALKMALEKNK